MFCVLHISTQFLFLKFFPHSDMSRERDYTMEFDYFLRGKESMRMDVRVPQIEGFSKDQVHM